MKTRLKGSYIILIFILNLLLISCFNTANPVSSSDSTAADESCTLRDVSSGGCTEKQPPISCGDFLPCD